jgi:hypothetical protein
MLPPTSLRPGSLAIFLSGLGKRPSVPTRRPLILLETPRIHNSYWLVASLHHISHNILQAALDGWPAGAPKYCTPAKRWP